MIAALHAQALAGLGVADAGESFGPDEVEVQSVEPPIIRRASA
jgi:hypothetical protein